MARRTPGDGLTTKEEATALVLEPTSDEAKARAASTGIPGGAPGIIAEASTQIHGLPTPDGPPAVEMGEARVERFRVGPGPSKDGSWPILYGGARTQLAAGKVVSTAAYDVDYLRSQGVKLEALDVAEGIKTV